MGHPQNQVTTAPMSHPVSPSYLRANLGPLLADARRGQVVAIKPPSGTHEPLLYLTRGAHPVTALAAPTGPVADDVDDVDEVRRALIREANAKRETARLRVKLAEARKELARERRDHERLRERQAPSAPRGSVASHLTRELAANLHAPLACLTIARHAYDSMTSRAVSPQALREAWAERSGRIPDPAWEALFVAVVSAAHEERGVTLPKWVRTTPSSSCARGHHQPLGSRRVARSACVPWLWDRRVMLTQSAWDAAATV